MREFTGTYGPAYNERLDGERIRKQHEVIRDLTLGFEWWTLHEISERTGYPEASISAQLRHLRKKRFGGYTVNKRRREEEGGTWEYQVEGDAEHQCELCGSRTQRGA